MKKHLHFFILLFFSSYLSFAQWKSVNTGMGNQYVTAFAVNGSNLFVGSTTGVFLSTNSGANWTAANTGLPANHAVRALAVSGTNLFAAIAIDLSNNCSVFLSTNNGTSWTPANTGLPIVAVQALAVIGNTVFAGTTGAGSSGVFKSTNNGTSWTAVNTGLPTNLSVNTLAVSGTNLLAGSVSGSNFGVYISSNNGTNWSTINTGLQTNTGGIALATIGSNLFVATLNNLGQGTGVYTSSNNGANWTAVNTGLTNQQIWALAVSTSNLFAGSYAGVFLSKNNGTNWTNVGLSSQIVHAFAISGNNIFAGTSNGVFQASLAEPPLGGSVSSSTAICSGTNSGTLKVGGNNSNVIKWQKSNDGFSSNIVNIANTDTFLIYNNLSQTTSYRAVVQNVFLDSAISSVATVTVYPLPSTPTITLNANILSSSISNSYQWYFNGTILTGATSQSYTPTQNGNYTVKITDGNGCTNISAPYNMTSAGINELNIDDSEINIFPNPTSSKVTLDYLLSAESFVSIDLYNVMGEKVKAIFNNQQSIGNHNVLVDVSELSNGIYFVKGNIDNGVFCKKIIIQLDK